MNEVFDKPVLLQKQVPESGAWEDMQHLHASVNKAIAAQRFSAESDNRIQRLVFSFRYGGWLESVRSQLQDYRLVYGGRHYEITDYDDYKEQRRVIRITGERYELTVTVELLCPTAEMILGVRKKVYPDSGTAVECAWQPQPSEERKVNGIVSVIERAKITARMRPAITADCRLKREDGTLWEIIGVPENTGLSDRWQVFIVRRISGGA